MDFGKLPSIQGVDFRLPEPEERTLENLRRTAQRSPAPRVRLHWGAPIWGKKEWIGRLYPPGAQPKDFLKHYARQLTGIELNSTFYGIPSPETLRGWRASVGEDFRFCPKVHQQISHVDDPSQLEARIDAFKAAMAELEPNLGLCFLQLPPGFAPPNRELLKRIQAAFGDSYPLAVEFRHPGWFDRGRIRPGAFEWLAERGVSTVISDVAGRRDVLHASLPTSKVMVRFVGNQLHRTDFERIDAWAERLRLWIEAGLEEAHFFIHQPDSAAEPDLLRYWVRTMNRVCGLALREWKAPLPEAEQEREEAAPDQLKLFG